MSVHMAATTTMPDGATSLWGRTSVMDDGRLVEIAGSCPDVETAQRPRMTA